MLLEELEGRMMAGVESRRATVTATPPMAPVAQRPSRQVTQDSLRGNSGGGDAAGACPAARNFCPLLAEEDMTTLQKQAKALLRRRQTSSCPSSQASGCQAASPATLPAATPAVEELKSIAMLEIVQRFAQERQTEAEARHRALLSRLQQQERGTSLPILSTPSSSFSSIQQQGGNGGGSSSPFSSVMSRRESNDSCESSDHSSSASTQHRHPQQTAAASPSSPSNDDNGCHQVTDLLDVVGGMMMMSRRPSC